jgi:hypothetical protein
MGKAKPKAKAAGGRATAGKVALSKAAEDLAGRIAPDVEDRLLLTSPPEGAQAAPGDFGARLRKGLPYLLTGLMEAGEIAKDGQVSPAELARIAGTLADLICGLRTGSA